MEQPIGPFIQPVPSAGTDPAYIPGLSSPQPDEAEAKVREEAVTEDVTDDLADEVTEEEEGTESEPEAEADEPEAEADGPVFKVSDRRSSITADRTGVRFTLDGEEAEFGWEEIGAVEVDTPRFGRRFAITVYTSTRRWYEADVEAPARGRLKEWTAELDVVLDAYFEQAEQDEPEKDKAEDQ